MAEIVVSVAEFKANLSRILADGRASRKIVVITSRKRPIATVVPYATSDTPTNPGGNGLASLAGAWGNLAELSEVIASAYDGRQAEGYREVSF